MTDTPLRHIAIIMDGNRRWARSKSVPQIEGHRRGAKRIQEILEEAEENGIEYCTLWAFSTENWKRNPLEVKALMALFEEYLKSHLEQMNKKNVQIRHIGRSDRLPKGIAQLFENAVETTKNNTGVTLLLAVDYGGRDEILRAVQKACEQGKSHWTEADFSVLLDTAGVPDPDLVIRTSGEQRLSGFLAWQCSYSELYFTQVPFPEFDREELQKAIQEYYKRKRTLGA